MLTIILLNAYIINKTAEKACIWLIIVCILLNHSVILSYHIYVDKIGTSSNNPYFSETKKYAI